MRRQNALQMLIQDHLDRTGETMSEVASRGGLPRQTVSALMTRTEYQSTPHRATLDKLAKGLRLSRQTVREAAALSLSTGPGHTAATPRVQILLDLTRSLTDVEIEILTATATAMVASKDGGTNGRPLSRRGAR
jgi:hypothetical protein